MSCVSKNLFCLGKVLRFSRAGDSGIQQEHAKKAQKPAMNQKALMLRWCLHELRCISESGLLTITRWLGWGWMHPSGWSRASEVCLDSKVKEERKCPVESAARRRRRKQRRRPRRGRTPHLTKVLHVREDDSMAVKKKKSKKSGKAAKKKRYYMGKEVRASRSR